MTTVFGEVAQLYDDVRPGYPPAVAEAIAAYAGSALDSVVEIGSGTGKGTQVLARLDVPLTCVEPDARMAAVLASKFPQVSVVVSSFERWAPPPGGVSALACAMAWHWLDPQTRNRRAFDALRPGGTLAVFGHQYTFADPAGAAAVEGVFKSLGLHHVDKPESWFYDEIAASGLWTDVRSELFAGEADFTTERYLLLQQTFSVQRLRAEAVQRQVQSALREAIDGLGGGLRLALRTTLVVARRPPAV